MALPWEEDKTHSARTSGPSSTWEHPAAIDEDKLLEQCTFGQGRKGGPGGQNRNKVETAVLLTHKPTGIHAQASERRYMGENKSLATRRLRLALATQVRAGLPAGHSGTERWKARLRKPQRQSPKARAHQDELSNDPLFKSPPKPAPQRLRIECNPKHKDYPALLAEALDAIADAGWEAKDASVRLNVSTSQLIKLIKDHPPAMHALNAEREKRGLKTLS